MSRELIRQRQSLVEKMRELVTRADAEGRSLSTEESARFDAMDADLEALKARIDLESRSVRNPITDYSIADGAPQTSENRAERAAFDAWLRYGTEGLAPEQRQIMARRRSFVTGSDLPAEVRALAVGTGAAGGYVVPQGFSGELAQSLKAYGGMRAASRLFPTPDGRDIPWPTVDDTSNVGELLAENTAAASLDVAFGQVTLKAYKYSSKLVPVSMELLQDSFFDVGAILRGLLAERIGRITNTHFTTGTGTGQPKGVVTESSLGKQGTTGQTLTLIVEDLVDLEHSVDPLYRPNARWMMNDATLKVIKKMKDTTGRFLFQASLAAGTPDTISGYPFTINQDIAVMAASAKSVLFGDFSTYIVRDALDVTLLRLVERYAELGQVGFLAFARADGRSIQPAAIKYYQNSAT